MVLRYMDKPFALISVRGVPVPYPLYSAATFTGVDAHHRRPFAVAGPVTRGLKPILLHWY
jgi:hypothetical protein